MDPTQFDQLIAVLAKEPESNLLSAANITAIVSIAIAIILGVFTVLHSRYEKRSRDAEFLFQSERDYGDLFESLVVVGDWEKEPAVSEKLQQIDFSCCPADCEKLISSVDVPDHVWENARKIKIHFKAIAKFQSQNIVSNDAIELALDHWGYRLLMGTVRKLDLVRFCYARRDAPNRINESEFLNDMAWYDELRKLKKI